jgi:hypothetical protein
LEVLVELLKASKVVNFLTLVSDVKLEEYGQGRLPKAWGLFEYMIEVDIQRTVLLKET